MRAIADGTVVYVRQPTARPADPAASQAHPLGYHGGWTDDGVVIVRHDTEIGTDAQGTATQVRFFSLYVHLNSIARAVSVNQTIYRKAEIGRAGMFGGKAHTLHFEIICDQANLKRLIGRDSGTVNVQADGRRDAVFGQMYFRLPATTQVHATRPALNDPAPAGGQRTGPGSVRGHRTRPASHAGESASVNKAWRPC